MSGDRRAGAGESALARWRLARRAAIRRDWHELLTLVALLAGALVGVVLAGGLAQLLFAALVGATFTLFATYWLLGREVASLPWRCGAAGEQKTALVLRELGDGWLAEHDLASERGNIDHLVIGPAGVFLLETKRLTRRALVNGDALVSGRLRFSGASVRAAASRLALELERRAGVRAWVQPVVVVWGELTAASEERGVVYLRGEELVEWLQAQPQRLRPAEHSRLAAAAHALSKP